MGCEAITGIEPALLIERLEFRELIAMSSDECLFVRAYVLLQRNRLVVGSNLITAKDRVNLFDRDMKPLRDQR